VERNTGSEDDYDSGGGGWEMDMSISLVGGGGGFVNLDLRRGMTMVIREWWLWWWTKIVEERLDGEATTVTSGQGDEWWMIGGWEMREKGSGMGGREDREKGKNK